MADIDIKLKTKETIPACEFHSGFDKRLSCQCNTSYPMQDRRIVRQSSHAGILFGELSLPSQQSTSCLTWEEHRRGRVYNIIFGSPFFANETVRKRPFYSSCFGTPETPETPNIPNFGGIGSPGVQTPTPLKLRVLGVSGVWTPGLPILSKFGILGVSGVPIHEL